MLCGDAVVACLHLRSGSGMSTVRLKQVVGLASCLAGLLAADAAADDRLPFPEEKIPVAPSLLPVVVTAGGQRRFLSEFPDLRVGWDGMRFFSNYKNWWIVNYPLDRVVVKPKPILKKKSESAGGNSEGTDDSDADPDDLQHPAMETT